MLILNVLMHDIGWKEYLLHVSGEDLFFSFVKQDIHIMLIKQWQRKLHASQLKKTPQGKGDEQKYESKITKRTSFLLLIVHLIND